MKDNKYGIYGILGYPLAHSFSPGMHNAAFEDQNIRARYTKLELPPKEMTAFVKSLATCAFDGFNVTVPYKEEVLKGLKSIDSVAEVIGAVNTLVKVKGVFHGVNTDAYGFMRALKEDLGFDGKGKSVLMLGAGGAAKACGCALADSGVARLTITELDQKKMKALVRQVKRLSPVGFIEAAELACSKQKSFLSEFDLIVNATSCGLRKNDPVLIPKSAFPDTEASLFDLIYNPNPTRLMAAAKARGFVVSGGLNMLLYQGVRAWELWTGKKAPVNVMRAALVGQLK